MIELYFVSNLCGSMFDSPLSILSLMGPAIRTYLES